jgi:hypothetical protein
MTTEAAHRYAEESDPERWYWRLLASAERAHAEGRLPAWVDWWGRRRPDWQARLLFEEKP